MSSSATAPQPSPPDSSPVEREVGRIRELTNQRQFLEALSATQTLSAEVPENRDVLYLMALNQRQLHRIADALATLERLERLHPRFSRLYQERGHCYVFQKDAPRAIDAFLRAVNINPALPTSWSMLEGLYRLTGQPDNAATAAAHVATLKRLPPEVVQATSLFSDGDLAPAEADHPRLSAEARRSRRGHAAAGHASAMARDVLDDAELLLEAVLELAPDYQAARYDYAQVLLERHKYALARRELETAAGKLMPGKSAVTARWPPPAASAWASTNARSGFTASCCSDSPRARRAASVDGPLAQDAGTRARRPSTPIAPRRRPARTSAMPTGASPISRPTASPMRRSRGCAPGRPRRPPPRSIAITCASRSARRWRTAASTPNPGATTSAATRSSAPRAATGPRSSRPTPAGRSRSARRTSSPSARGCGVASDDPIFIVGLPRSGSTLIEQILASHSQVEGTQELADIPRIVLGAAGPRAGPRRSALPGGAGGDGRRGFPPAGRAIPGRYPRLPHRQAAFHRQDAEQFPAHRPDPPDAAQRQDHRRAARADGVLLQQPQAAVRHGPGVHLQHRGHRPLLPHLSRADAALGRGAAGPGAARAARGRGGRPGGQRAADAGVLRPAVRAGLRRVPQDRAQRAHAPAPSRCASRSSARASTSGGTTSPGSGRCEKRSGTRWTATGSSARWPRRLLERRYQVGDRSDHQVGAGA